MLLCCYRMYGSMAARRASSEASTWCLTESTALGGVRVYDQFDVSLEDGDLLGEVELVTTLMIAASEYEGRLPISKLDELLGLTPQAPVNGLPRSGATTGHGR